MFLNWLFRWILVGPFVRLLYPIKVEGRENLPRRGGYIMALGPHRTEGESVKVASYLRRRQLIFFAKEEYWQQHPLLGRLMTAIGLIPLPRRASRAVLEQISQGVKNVRDDRVVAMYIEATRGLEVCPEMHRGYAGFAYISLRAGGKPIVPVALIGMREMKPFRRGARIVIDEPIYPLTALRNPEHHKLAEKALEQVLVKPLVTKVSKRLAELAGGIPYVDIERPIPGS